MPLVKYEGALFPGRALPGGHQIFGETKKGALFERPIKKGAFCFCGSVWVRVPSVPKKAVCRSFVFQLKSEPEKPRKRPIGCAFTRIRSKLTIIGGAADGTWTHINPLLSNHTLTQSKYLCGFTWFCFFSTRKQKHHLDYKSVLFCVLFFCKKYFHFQKVLLLLFLHPKHPLH